MKINRELLFQLYMERVDEIIEVCDWKTNFGPEEIVGIISSIIEENTDVIIGNRIDLPFLHRVNHYLTSQN
jgi:hypothetical protein